MKIYHTLISIFVLLFTTQCDRTTKDLPSQVLATFDGGSITQEELDQELDLLPPEQRLFFRSPQGRKELLERLVDRKLLVQASEKRGIDKERKVQKRIDQCRQEILIEEFLQRSLFESEQITESKIEEYYQNHLEDFRKPERVTVRQIVVSHQAQADQLLARIKRGADFSRLAQQFSIDPSSRDRGGEMDPISRGELEPSLEAAVFALKVPGEVSPVIATPFGYHIFQLISKEESQVPPLEEVQEEIEETLRQEEAENHYRNLVARLREETHLIYRGEPQ